ncbi:hypothetical protein ACGFYQ_33970 [Streptomyces sp. NPDC048258]|uniref:hypothetical protein n=1 Tax=Streptomyces sp. NPDC048258 TaxID=3365527 RepID=UPI003711492B
MTTDKTAAAVSDVAAEAIRDLNHLTRSAREGFEYPADAYSTVANLAAMAARLPQALDQLAAFIKGLEESGRLRSDKDTLADDLEATYAGLTIAAGAAKTLQGALDRAHNGLGPIAYKE